MSALTKGYRAVTRVGSESGAGDLGIRRAVQAAYGWDRLPTENDIRDMGERWRPYRSLATAYLYGSLRAAPA